MEKELEHNWNVVCTDNFARESVADYYVVRHLTKDQAERICEILREDTTDTGSTWYVVMHNDSKLCVGMADLF